MLLKSILSGALALTAHFSCSYAAAINTGISARADSLDPVSVPADDGGDVLNRPTRNAGWDNNVYMANDAGQVIYVMAALNPDWAVPDFIANIALTVLGIEEIKAIVGAAELPAEIKTLTDLYNLLKISGQLISASITVATRPPEAVLALHHAIRKHALVIQNGDSADVNHSNAFEIYLSLDGLASLAKAKNISLLVMSKDGRQTALFNTNSDYSWIATKNQKIVRSVYGGSLFEEDKDAADQAISWPITQAVADPDSNEVDGPTANHS